ncbi:hypothetical protein B0G71_7927 [Paraburkholderia sp. BL27I4N3]|uniref:hypothetical protein n=1 Tax=Paraburkholderia sp. BL27I4N3 TaxID=1938805 RepID=UPI000E237455|nr:hypothetical protein [Paraburkholderia sp. BL27I4N3]REE07423.1 hypothetical protein B0G71_7927 [Paraburkholderia sp. BL27I4N3]
MILEGIEVVFIVMAVGAAGGQPGFASLGAAMAFVVVVGLGLIVHRPIARVPENTLKFVVGVLLCAFNTFWSGEGIGVTWPGADGSTCADRRFPGGCRHDRWRLPESAAGRLNPLPPGERDAMHTIKSLIHKLLGLFVGDASLALVALGWVTVCALAFRHVDFVARWPDALLWFGLAVILVGNVWRDAGRRRA